MSHFPGFAQLPWIFHIFVELPATIAFAIYPSATLTVLQPHAHIIIRQYALLLLSSNVIAALFVVRDGDQDFIERGVAGALSLYHLGPAGRAIHRGSRNGVQYRLTWEHPWLHAMAHLTCWIALLGRSLAFW